VLCSLRSLDFPVRQHRDNVNMHPLYVLEVVQILVSKIEVRTFLHQSAGATERKHDIEQFSAYAFLIYPTVNI